MISDKILAAYEKLKKADSYSHDACSIITEISYLTSEYLSSLPAIELQSKVKGKHYFAFAANEKYSRAINKALFQLDAEEWDSLATSIVQGAFDQFDNPNIDKILYSTAISFCASIDLIKSRDQKTPGTFFEYFIAFLYAWRLRCSPIREIQVLNLDGDTKLKTDFIFDLGQGQNKFHLPVKTSTRERAIMLWAHQRLLDGVYGVGTFMGTPVCLAETKTDKRKREVVEICTPRQWQVYQIHIARLKRVYYLDVPEEYQKLDQATPKIIVRPFSQFFKEWKELSPN